MRFFKVVKNIVLLSLVMCSSCHVANNDDLVWQEPYLHTSLFYDIVLIDMRNGSSRVISHEDAVLFFHHMDEATHEISNPEFQDETNYGYQAYSSDNVIVCRSITRDFYLIYEIWSNETISLQMSSFNLERQHPDLQFCYDRELYIHLSSEGADWLQAMLNSLNLSSGENSG